MKPKHLFFVAGLLFSVAGCTTSETALGLKPTAAPITAEAKFTIPHFYPWQVDVRPKATKLAAPEYPLKLVRDGGKGYADVLYIVDADGTPREVQCVKASSAAVARAAVAAVSRDRYLPARKGGKAVAVLIERRFHYRFASIGQNFGPEYSRPYYQPAMGEQTTPYVYPPFFGSGAQSTPW